MSDEYLPSVKHKILTISIGQTQAGVDTITAQRADAEISEWVDKGYRLVSANSVGFYSNGAVVMSYVLVKSDA